MKKRNYRAERQKASNYADNAMDSMSIKKPEWLEMWGLVYRAYLAGLRASQRR